MDRTLDSEGRSRIAASIVERWGSDFDSVRFVRSSSNFVYVFRRESRPYFLRFASDRERSAQAIATELELLTWLSAHGVPVVEPVASLERRLLEAVQTDAGVFHCVVFGAAPGEQRDSAEVRRAGHRAWGAALGALHAALKARPKSELLGRGSWVNELVRARADLHPVVRRELSQVQAELTQLPAGSATYGPIHGDFELDNLFWNGKVTGIIDFEGCVQNWYAAESPCPATERRRSWTTSFGPRLPA